jgi:hypothetical protein
MMGAPQMKDRFLRILCLLGLAIVLLTVPNAKPADAVEIGGGDYSLSWTGFGSSGPPSSGGGYTLFGSPGDAVAVQASAGDYTMNSGFLTGFALQGSLAYFPLVVKP